MSSVSVPVMDDMLAEGVNETFDLMLSSSLGPAITVDEKHAVATGVIIDTTSELSFISSKCNVTNCELNFIVLTVMFQSEQYIGSESSRFIEVVVIISGGSSTTSISITLTITVARRSAGGKGYS